MLCCALTLILRCFKESDASASLELGVLSCKLSLTDSIRGTAVRRGMVGPGRLFRRVSGFHVFEALIGQGPHAEDDT